VQALVQCAASHSPVLAAARLEQRAVLARRLSAELSFPSNPALDLQGGVRRLGPGSYSFDRAIGLSQAFEVGGQRGARLAASDAESEVADALLEASLAEVSAAVLAAAVEVRWARLERVAASDASASAERLVELSRGRAAHGVGIGLNVDLAEAALLTARRDERERQRAVDEAEVRLSQSVGASVALAVDAEVPELRWEASLAELETLAVAHRKEPRQAFGAARVATAQAGVLQRDWYPRPTVGVGLRQEENATIGALTLSVPLPVFRRNQSELAAQQVQVEQADAQRVQAELEVRLQVRAAYAGWARARSAQPASPDLDARLRADLAALQTAYAQGSMSMTSTLASLREVALARRQLAQLQAETVRASVALARAVNTPTLTEVQKGARP
jgi:cobalt-zinc-cadmium efflux system outer membrane protein